MRRSQVSFHASGNANPSPATRVLHAARREDPRRRGRPRLAARPSGRVGGRAEVPSPTGRSRSSAGRATWIPPACGPGTFGSQQKPVPLLSFVTSADAGAAITGIRQDAAFRTNVGFAAGADGASYALTLATADGATVGDDDGLARRLRLDAAGHPGPLPDRHDPAGRDAAREGHGRQPRRLRLLDRQPLGGPRRHADRAAAGRDSVRATIGPAGGSIRSDDGRLTLRVPAGALASAPRVLVRDGYRERRAAGDRTELPALAGGVAFASPRS